MSLIFNFINENKKRRANRPAKLKGESHPHTFSGAFTRPERIEVYKEIHRRRKAGYPMLESYERASIKLGFRSNSSVVIGYRLWLGTLAKIEGKA